MSRVATSLCAATTIGCLAALGIAATTPADAAGQRHALRTTVASWTATAHSTGHAPGSRQTALRVYLAPNGGLDALKAAVAKVSDPSSHTYRHFLTASGVCGPAGSVGISRRTERREPAGSW